jgi:hypothetical protein
MSVNEDGSNCINIDYFKQDFKRDALTVSFQTRIEFCSQFAYDLQVSLIEICGRMRHQRFGGSGRRGSALRGSDPPAKGGGFLNSRYG